MTPEPAFIFSAPRSGTTWLVEALNAHREIVASELRAFGDYVDLVQDDTLSRPRLRVTLDRYVDALLAHHTHPVSGQPRDAARHAMLRLLYRTIVADTLARTGKPVFVDKITPYAGTAAVVSSAMALTFPTSRVVDLIRDGRDVAVSGVFHWFNRHRTGEPPTAAQTRRRAFFARPGSARLDRFFSDDELAAWANHWAETVDARASRPPMRSILIRYEDLSADLGVALRRLFEFLGVSTETADIERAAARASFDAMSGGRQRGQNLPGAHVRNGVVGDWRRYFTARDGALFDELAGEALRRTGYVPDSGWIRGLPERLDLAA